MKKRFLKMLNSKIVMVSIAACTLMVPVGCGSGGGGITNPLTAIPNITNFLLKATTAFVAGAASTIQIASSTLGNGTFTVGFNLTGGNILSGSATLIMNGGVGTFTTPTLTSDAPTTVTITSVSNSAGGNATPTSNNTSSLFDSTGLMVATYTPHGGSPVSFNATDVKASLAGTLLNIQGVVWQPDLKTINLYEDNYSGSTGTVSFNSADLTPGDPNSAFNGNAHYGESGSTTIADISSHGSVIIKTTSPLLTGSFTYTNPDSSVVAGTFSCPAP